MGKNEDEVKGPLRLVRLFLLVLVILLVVGLVKTLSGQQLKLDSLSGLLKIDTGKFGKLSLSKSGLNEKPEAIENFESFESSVSSEMVKGVGESQEVEPIAEPVTNVQNQANTLVEMIKRLPEDQVKAIKKQLCKELCE